MSEFLPARELEVQPHYAYVTRSIMRLFVAGRLSNISQVLVEPDYGYSTQLTYQDGSSRITYGNDLGLNSAAASDLARDKGHTKSLLRSMDVDCPEGEDFLLPWWVERIGTGKPVNDNLKPRTTDQASTYIERRGGYPVYAKPVNGSKGGGVHKLHDEQTLREVIEEFETDRVPVMVIEESIDLPDYRLVILDGELISAYRRDPLSIVGDGHRTIEEHLLAKQKQYHDEGRDTRIDRHDPRILHHLARQCLQLSDVVVEGQKVTLADISNLSTGGTSEDVTDVAHSAWVALAARIANQFNLRLIGLDLACADITQPDTGYSVLEVNSSPGLDHYASSGANQAEVVDNLYEKVLNVLPLTHTDTRR